MLTKIEETYLYILRVVVLIAASLALIGAVLGAIRAAPAIASLVESHPAPVVVPGATLGDFVTEKRLAATSPQPTSSAAPNEPPQAIKDAVDRLDDYYQRTTQGQTIDKKAAIDVLMNNRSQLPDDAQDAYAQSILSLMNQLDQSKGDPLSLDTINDLIPWHFAKFKANIDAETARRAAAQAETMQSLAVAGVGIAVFVAIVFCFLVVKIERNLRLVRTEAVTSKPVHAS
jgi:hypothetical protein